ncbi:hypothetical protein BDP27DRAFT_1238098 [Rhodocollybia butyracea]|uniref:VWFA domain-containing protein n=1 Tax=Rhodocollybia butyracea TaxID=206335 RepID=A0A9P5PAD7_9AGAR|nr:hypothetical protein BDP27DRAFT_1238098 [Rhodocollybia butyracea]
MPLEATMMVIDNSEYMRNGDYQPSRFDAQADAVNIVFQTKIDSNPENTVGIMSMAGKGPEVLVTHSKDLGQILKAIHTTSSKVGGAIDIPTAIAVAQLALKHRENKNLRQRIIVFVGSPLEGPAADEKGMVKLAKKLKKNNVAVDVVCFGDGIEEPVPGQEDKSVLKSFVENASSGDNSHLVVVPVGARLISDVLISSPILSDDRSASIPAELGGTGGDGPGASAGGDFEFGVDPSLDPELAMVGFWHVFIVHHLYGSRPFVYQCRRLRREKQLHQRRPRIPRRKLQHLQLPLSRRKTRKRLSSPRLSQCHLRRKM